MILVPRYAAPVEINMVNAGGLRHRKLHHSLALTDAATFDSDPLKINDPITHS
ncbi:hypothetical protein [Leptospira sp. severe_002]|uniref:hypothetical protein n=1 Tax=Leptospira sp. severe_002 TaxID=2838237 RepID=UPI001E410D0D|nr:hypothetical protein [Leptospira sp. severe_002]